MNIRRNRFIQGVLCITVILLGLGIRRYAGYLPQILAVYGGDILWALMIYIGFGLLWSRTSVLRLFLYTLAFSYFIEVSQLYQGQWIMDIRGTTLGALVLGHGFLWSDLVCYTIGALLGVMMEKYVLIGYRRSIYKMKN